MVYLTEFYDLIYVTNVYKKEQWTPNSIKALSDV